MRISAVLRGRPHVSVSAIGANSWDGRHAPGPRVQSTQCRLATPSPIRRFPIRFRIQPQNLPNPNSPSRSHRVQSSRRGIRHHRTHQGRTRIFRRCRRAHRSLNFIMWLSAAVQRRRRRVRAAFTAALCRLAESRLRALLLACAEIAE